MPCWEIFNRTNDIYKNKILKGQNRILDICIKEKADQYINPIGGKELYSSELFRDHEIKLKFLKTEGLNYNQFSSEFVPWLSMIDVMMFNTIEKINNNLTFYKLT